MFPSNIVLVYYVTLCKFLLHNTVNPLHVYTYLFSLEPPCHPAPSHPLGNHRALSRAPRVMQQLPTSYPFCTWERIYVIATLSISPPSASLAVSTSPFSIYESLFLLCKRVHQYHFPGFHIHALIHDICFPISGSLHSV